jgi:GNAT superfamily N-acetyltransferase
LSVAARCYVALWRLPADDDTRRGDELSDAIPVAFCATLPIIGRRKHWRISRIVTLPDYQGIGIGMCVAESVAEIHRREGHRLNVTASHPALVRHCRDSPRWTTIAVRRIGAGGASHFIPGYRDSTGRAVVSFEYVGSD